MNTHSRHKKYSLPSSYSFQLKQQRSMKNEWETWCVDFTKFWTIDKDDHNERERIERIEKEEKEKRLKNISRKIKLIKRKPYCIPNYFVYFCSIHLHNVHGLQYAEICAFNWINFFFHFSHMYNQSHAPTQPHT